VFTVTKATGMLDQVNHLLIEFRSKSEIPKIKLHFSKIRENFLLKKQNKPEYVENMDKLWFF